MCFFVRMICDAFCVLGNRNISVDKTKVGDHITVVM